MAFMLSHFRDCYTRALKADPHIQRADKDKYYSDKAFNANTHARKTIRKTNSVAGTPIKRHQTRHLNPGLYTPL